MKKALVAALLMLVAIPLLVAVAALPRHGSPDTPVHTHISARYLERGPEEAGSANIVTGVLLNYRGLDTAGEVTVIFTALAAVLAVLIVGSGGGAGDERATQTQAPGHPTRATQHPVSEVVLFVVRLLAPFIALFALYTILNGHVSPGGGFQGGAILGALFVALTVVLGEQRTRRLLYPPLAVWLHGAAVLAFVAIGTLGAVLTGYFLGYPAAANQHLLRELMLVALEFGIGLGGAAIFATIFLQMEVD